MWAFLLAIPGVFAATPSCAASETSYQLVREYNSTNFFDGFNFRSSAYYISQGTPSGDPTDGSVNYLSQDDATAQGLINTDNNQVYIGADSTNIAQPLSSNSSQHGRNSVRIEAKETYSSGLVIADIAHQPGTACGVWPSYWSYDFEDNSQGELDVIEGVDIQSQNIVSLHTCGECSFTNIGPTDDRSNCNIGGTVTDQCLDGSNFDGCGNTMSSGSYGSAFNDLGGGVFATYLEPDAVKLYWWPRSSVPSDIQAGTPDPSQWGTPASLFTSGNSCNVTEFFKSQTIVINIDFCGASIPQSQWEADSCQQSTGVSTCDDYVTNYPAAFNETYWVFNYIKVYQ